jgi:small subunit ribosomal protein S21
MAVNVEVLLDKFDDIDRALKTMKKLMLKDGVFKEMKKRAYYEKPSQARRRKQAEARKKVRKAQKKREATEARFEDVKFTRRAQGPLDSTPKGTL